MELEKGAHGTFGIGKGVPYLPQIDPPCSPESLTTWGDVASGNSSVFDGYGGNHRPTWTDVLTTLVGNVWLSYMWLSLYAAEIWTGDQPDDQTKEFSEPPPDDPDE